ncbi:MAG: hypothetical protein IK115_14460 [Lachnospiraceae bacterium]|nr:hypothetical protein [Lachnospiraceae bacterium]
MRTGIKNSRVKRCIFHFLLLLEAAGIVTVLSYFARCSYGEMLKRALSAVLGVMIYLFTYEQEFRLKRFFVNSSLYPFRGEFIYILLLPVSALLSLLPITAWPYPFIFTLLSVLSGPLTGIAGGAVLLIISTTLAGATSGAFLLYFLAALLSVVIFSDTEKAYSSRLPLLAQTFIYVFLLSCILFFHVPGEFSLSQILIPLSNAVINAFLMLSLIHFMNVRHLEKRKKEYSFINDQTAPLMELCRSEEPALYMRSVHVSHFTTVLAKSLGADMYLCRGGGYYERLRDFPGMPKSSEELTGRMVKAGFPLDLRELILQGDRKPFASVEAMIVTLSGRLVDDLLHLKSEGRDVTKLWPDLVNRRLKELYLSDALERLDLSFAGFAGMEKALLAEKKYLMLL